MLISTKINLQLFRQLLNKTSHQSGSAAVPHIQLPFSCNFPALTHLQRIHSVGVALQRVETRLCFWVPHFDHEVIGSAYYPPPIVLDAANRRHMAHQDV